MVFSQSEFDIAESPQFDDPSSSHIGIDINSLRSINTTDTFLDPKLSLIRNFTFQTWIEFNASTNLVQVWLMNYGNMSTYANSLDRMSESLVLQAYIDPSVFNHTSMWVGITATSGSTVNANDTKPSGYAIYYWYFQIYDERNISLLQRLIFLITFSLLFLIIIIIIIGVIIAYRNGCGALCRIFRTRKSELHAAHEAASADIQQFSYNVLKRATHNFSDKI